MSKWFLLVPAFCAFMVVLSLCASSCNPKQPLAPEPLLLSFSGYFALRTGGQLGHPGSGVIVIVHVHNHGRRVAVVPVAAVFSNLDSRFIAQSRGQLTNEVNEEFFTATDRIRYLREGQELPSVTFVPVDFEKNPWVYVEWAFVREDETWEF